MFLFSPKLKRTVWLPILIGIGIFGLWRVAGFASSVASVNNSAIQNYEFTVWGDSLDFKNPSPVRMVQLSELEAVRASMLLLQNKSNLIPFQNLEQKSFHLLTIGNRLPYFEEYLGYYAQLEVSHAINPRKLPKIDWASCQPLIVALNAPGEEADRLADMLLKLRKKTDVVVVNFDRAEKLKDVASFETILQVPSSQTIAQMISAQVLFGGVPVYRGIPEKLADKLSIKEDYYVQKVRLGYSDPERVGIPGDSLLKIDQIVAEGMGVYAFPGCQVLIARKGQVIFHKAYGYHTYRRNRPVRKTDLYDIASITKIAATTLGTMHMYEKGALKLDEPLRNYFEDPSYIPTRVRVFDTISAAEYMALADSVAADTSGRFSLTRDTTRLNASTLLLGRWVRGKGEVKERSPVFDIRLRDLLTHTSGLPATLPIGYYQRKLRNPYVSKVVENRALPNLFADSLWNETKGLRVDSTGYCYSCVNMVLMQRLIDSLNQRSINEFLAESFYKPLGLQTTTYNPIEKFPAYRLIPTASDHWRNQLVHGTVHDPIAALMGGISGNAGLFSNANDLAILGQMWLNGGEYGGERFLADSTVNIFTRRQYGHRGLGFDKPPRKSEYIVGESASVNTYGHTGFTGTCMWIDPEEELVYIFLSNRIYPA